jgi:outer membrane protein assembly factor BamD (BamD/ComL family)
VRSDPEQALRELSELREQFPEGALAKEAELVRIEAYLRLGRRADAEALGQKLISNEPRTRKTVDRLLQGVRPH